MLAVLFCLAFSAREHDQLCQVALLRRSEAPSRARSAEEEAGEQGWLSAARGECMAGPLLEGSLAEMAVGLVAAQWSRSQQRALGP